MLKIPTKEVRNTSGDASSNFVLALRGVDLFPYVQLIVGLGLHAKTYFDVNETPLIAVPPEGMAVLLAVYVDTLPSKLLDGDERLVDVCVFRDEVRSQVKREAFRVENVRGRLRKVC